MYAPERLDLRVFYLEHVVLPGLRAQTDPDFRVIMLMGAGLPEPWRGRVLALIADVPQVEARFAPEGQPHQAICHEVFQTARRAGKRPVTAEFRIDDDDAVAVDFVARAREAFAQLEGLYEDAGKLVVDFSRGFVLYTWPEGVSVKAVSARYWGCGLMMFFPTKGKESIPNFHHARMWKRLPVLSLPRRPMFVRGAHGQNDSGINKAAHNAVDMPFAPEKIPAAFADRFAIDLAALEAGWRDALADHLPRPQG